jgi:hypothetical protein
MNNIGARAHPIIFNELIDLSVTCATSHPVTGTHTLPYSFPYWSQHLSGFKKKLVRTHLFRVNKELIF